MIGITGMNIGACGRGGLVSRKEQGKPYVAAGGKYSGKESRGDVISGDYYLGGSRRDIRCWQGFVFLGRSGGSCGGKT